jgi:Protein of unknown function (DUF2914)/Tetratricopeptide repeat
MPAATELQSLTSAAEEAASAGDYVSAEQQLRLAVELQEESAGPMHPDLANMLNNLGVVYEHLERQADAERCYRRAFAIASAVLDANHPFVTLSATNLRGFCLARGIPFEPPAASTPSPEIAAEPELSSAVGPEPRPAEGPDFSRATDVQSHASRTAEAAEEATSIPAPSAPRRRIGLVVAAAGALALIAIVLVAVRSRSTGGAEAPPPQLRTAPVAPDAPVASGGAEAPPPQQPDAPVAPVAPDVPVLVSAELCRTLETRGAEWRCAPATGVLQPGTLFFYTRVASPVDATIEHRWYRNDRLHQTVPLRVRANPQDGFRTYSRMTVSADRTGDWRVELRTRGGEVLREERFTVAP